MIPTPGEAEISDVCVTSGTEGHTTSLRGDRLWRYDNSLEGGSWKWARPAAPS